MRAANVDTSVLGYSCGQRAWAKGNEGEKNWIQFVILSTLIQLRSIASALSFYPSMHSVFVFHSIRVGCSPSLSHASRRKTQLLFIFLGYKARSRSLASVYVAKVRLWVHRTRFGFAFDARLVRSCISLLTPTCLAVRFVFATFCPFPFPFPFLSSSRITTLAMYLQSERVRFSIPPTLSKLSWLIITHTGNVCLPF